MGKGGLDKKRCQPQPPLGKGPKDCGLDWEGTLNNGRKGGRKEVRFKSRRYARSGDKYTTRDVGMEE